MYYGQDKPITQYCRVQPTACGKMNGNCVAKHLKVDVLQLIFSSFPVSYLTAVLTMAATIRVIFLSRTSRLFCLTPWVHGFMAVCTGKCKV